MHSVFQMCPHPSHRFQERPGPHASPSDTPVLAASRDSGLSCCVLPLRLICNHPWRALQTIIWPSNDFPPDALNLSLPPPRRWIALSCPHCHCMTCSLKLFSPLALAVQLHLVLCSLDVSLTRHPPALRYHFLSGTPLNLSLHSCLRRWWWVKCQEKDLKELTIIIFDVRPCYSVQDHLCHNT